MVYQAAYKIILSCSCEGAFKLEPGNNMTKSKGNPRLVDGNKLAYLYLHTQKVGFNR